MGKFKKTIKKLWDKVKKKNNPTPSLPHNNPAAVATLTTTSSGSTATVSSAFAELSLEERGIDLTQPQYYNSGRTALNLSGMNLSDKNMLELAGYLDKHPEIISIDLSRNNITAIGVKTLLGSNIKELDLSENNIGNEGAIAISQNENIEVLYLRENDLGPECCDSLAKARSLHTLDLSYNDIKDAGAILLSQSKSIQELFLCACQIGIEGVKALANSDLTLLDVGDNELTDREAIVLASSKTIRNLDVSDNKIDVLGIKALAANPNLLRLDIRTNGKLNVELISVGTELNPIKRFNAGFRTLQRNKIAVEVPSLVALCLFRFDSLKAIGKINISKLDKGTRGMIELIRKERQQKIITDETTYRKKV